MTKIKLPGVIDVHVHLREPGATQKEDFSTGTKAAIAGGVTVVLDMPNNLQPTISFDALQQKIDLAKHRIYVDVGFHFAAHSKSLPFVSSVADNVFAYKLFLNPTTGDLLVMPEEAEEVFEAIPENKIIIAHAEDETLGRAIALAKKYQRRLHVAHVSLSSEISMIQKAKEEGVSITAEVTPHHLFLTVDDTKRLGAYGIMKPPLQTQKDQDALWEALRSGVIDIVATDHAPHTIEEKESSENPPFGVPGVETSLPLLLTAVHDGKISIELLQKITHDNPKRIFAIPEQPDTYIEIDTDAEYTLENEKMFTKTGWTPFAGKKVYGKILNVYLRGGQVFDGEKIIGEPKGKIIRPV